MGGDDVYRGQVNHRPGMAMYYDRFQEVDEISSYWTDSSSMALFLDVGGTDTYATLPPPEPKEGDGDKEGADVAPQPFGGFDNTTWLDEPGSLNPKVRNCSIGVDRKSGTVSFTPIPEKNPTGRGRARLLQAFGKTHLEPGRLPPSGRGPVS